MLTVGPTLSTVLRLCRALPRGDGIRGRQADRYPSSPLPPGQGKPIWARVVASVGTTAAHCPIVTDLFGPASSTVPSAPAPPSDTPSLSVPAFAPPALRPSPQILVNGKPHMGTDKLMRILQNSRKHLEAAGVKYMFGCKVTGLEGGKDGQPVTGMLGPHAGDSNPHAQGHRDTGAPGLPPSPLCSSPSLPASSLSLSPFRLVPPHPSVPLSLYRPLPLLTNPSPSFCIFLSPSLLFLFLHLFLPLPPPPPLL